MTVLRISRPDLFLIGFLLCATGVVSGQFQLEPLNSTVLQGSDAQFNASVQGKWNIMTWEVRGFLVLTFPFTGNVISSSKQFSANFCSSVDTSCVAFTIHNVTRGGQAGPVVCTIQGDYGSKTAQLYVQESGTVNVKGGNVTVVQHQQVEFQCVTSAWFPTATVSWTRNGQAVNNSLYNTTSMADGETFNASSVLRFQAISNATVECRATVLSLASPESSSVFLVVVPKPPDWTVLIAVVVSIGGFALLVLLIIGIIFCCKRREEKQANDRDEMRAKTHSQISGGSAAGNRRGQENAGYVPEDQASVAPSKITDSGFSQASGAEVHEVAVNTNQTGNVYSGAHITAGESGVRKHRHLTIV
ncbi:immunoglobulin superfamily member 5 [Pseudoliparis swirei]|uniref:immunoglobulin superfamily member 5 n=1 Tax=Pseudoliparis swirei TaxID=2059687 RepID=UPI0024BE1C31|nr:immunoglobulin superfamily member 5 [Pseudoliparis swirei]XP_056299167.1 immunoglobulin superfamily member 5 [Pseudoliparis swirei]XP_056299175.1 immunoglobulin superfamily member 5 [Pseudoliparis swirei]XP_056299184.1 immunoglobulin superfamily member 5 [Pseudoliparis swirei]